MPSTEVYFELFTLCEQLIYELYLECIYYMVLLLIYCTVVHVSLNFMMSRDKY